MHGPTLQNHSRWRAPLRAASRSWFFDLAGRFTPTLALEEDGIVVWLHTSDKVPGRATFARGIPERRTLARACQLLGGPRGGMFVDVGAHIGTATLAALGWQGFDGAVCFEPDPRNASLLRANLGANRFLDRAGVIQAAVSDRSGSVAFELAHGNSGDGRVRLGAAQPGRFAEDTREVVDVQATTLDDCLENGTLVLERLGLVWLDVQGHEGHVLRGATRVLKAAVPVVFELWPYGLRRAGGLELVAEHAAAYGWAVDLRDGSEHDPSELLSLGERLQGIDYTDILLR